MSRTIEILNLLKRRVGELPLTPSQSQARHEITRLVALHGACNLYGAGGSGKTLLAWRLAFETGAHYSARREAVNEIAEAPAGLIVDKALAGRDGFRHLLAMAQVRQMLPLLVISRYPIEDDIARFELRCTREDALLARATLHGLLRELKLYLPPLEEEAEGSVTLDLWALFEDAVDRAR